MKAIAIFLVTGIFCCYCKNHSAYNNKPVSLADTVFDAHAYTLKTDRHINHADTPALINTTCILLNHELQKTYPDIIASSSADSLNYMHSAYGDTIDVKHYRYIDDTLLNIELVYRTIPGLFYTGALKNDDKNNIILTLGEQKGEDIEGYPYVPTIYKMIYNVYVPRGKKVNNVLFNIGE